MTTKPPTEQKRFVTGFCNPHNDPQSHARCSLYANTRCDCECHDEHTPTPSYPDGTYLVDRDRTVWLVVREGGMATRATYAGVVSIGIVTLASDHGPLTVLDIAKAVTDA